MVTISEIFHFINPSMSKILDLDVSFRHFSPISSAQKGDVTFCTDVSENGITLICSSKASLIICHSDLFKKIKNSESNLIFVDFPKLTFIRCLNKFTSSLPHYGIHPSSIVETKELGKNISIGPFCYISKNVVIGDNVKILGNVCIYDDTIIGNNVTIQASTVIGTDGFGYELNEEKKYEKFPHIGGVKIMIVWKLVPVIVLTKEH